MTVDKGGLANPQPSLSAAKLGSDEQEPGTISKPQDETTSDFAGADASEGNANQVTADMQLFIGRQLRAVYDDVAKQPVPDRFLELMKQLESKTSGA